MKFKAFFLTITLQKR
ncbi:TPA: YrzI family small protein, partial [Bacillus toyonensis]|nr:YrzI family small protein [Bacillus toyonensis]HDR7483784.1 YrzI family small protein [Bacillus toyonensis]